MANPLFDIGDEIYLKESAANGFLERFKIATRLQDGGEWVYSFGIPPKVTTSALFGDRVTHVHGRVLYFNESELVTICQAIDLIEQVLIDRLAEIRRLKSVKSCT